jgi:hypothetical protein
LLQTTYRDPFGSRWLCFARLPLRRDATFCVCLHRMHWSRRYAGDARYCVSTGKGTGRSDPTIWLCFAHLAICCHVLAYAVVSDSLIPASWLCFTRSVVGCGMHTARLDVSRSPPSCPGLALFRVLCQSTPVHQSAIRNPQSAIGASRPFRWLCFARFPSWGFADDCRLPRTWVSTAMANPPG